MNHIPSAGSFTFLITILTCIHLHAQNLVPNPSFEDYTTCPQRISSTQVMLCTPWLSPSITTPDYYNSCSNPSDAGVPDNFHGYQEARTGNAYVGCGLRGSVTNDQNREYIQAPLNSPLVAGKTYYVGFYICLTEQRCAIEHIGAVFTMGRSTITGNGLLNLIPQITSQIGFLADTASWVLIEGCFMASGGEDYITIGNFLPNQQNPLNTPCDIRTAYYYFEDVFVYDATPYLGPDVSLCPGDTTTIYAGIGNAQYQWQDLSTADSLVVSSPGTYTVEVTTPCGTFSDTIVVGINNTPPQINFPSQVSLCQGDSIIIASGISMASYLWNDGSQYPQLLVNTPGTYSLTVSNGCGSDADTLIVMDGGADPTVDLGPDLSLCPGDSLLLEPDNSNVVSWLWPDAADSSMYLVTSPGTLWVQVSNACGISSDTAIISESNDEPILDLGPDITACAGQTVTLQSGLANVDFLWQDGSTGPDYTTTQSGEFILHVNNHCGADTDTIWVDISGVPPTPVLGPDTSLCEGVILTLTSNSDAESITSWQDGSSSPVFNVTSPGSYILSLSNRCGAATDTILITYLDAPDPFSLGPDTTLCPGVSILLSSPSSFYDVLWQDGSGKLHLIADRPGTYWLQLTNECGTASDEIIIDIDKRIPSLSIDPVISWCEGDVITLDATQPFIAEYLWSSGASTPTLQIDGPGQYHIEVSTFCNTVSQQVEVVPGNDCVPRTLDEDMYIPNVFSPNGDGINDVFTVFPAPESEIVSMECTVFDRWGNLVFSSKEIPFHWNGHLHDELMNPGVYVYVIRVEYLTVLIVPPIKVFTGEVTLLK